MQTLDPGVAGRAMPGARKSGRKLPRKMTCARYGVCTKTIERWEKNPALKFPRALVINGRKYDDEDELDRWDAKQKQR
jgi:hypothetical protein